MNLNEINKVDTQYSYDNTDNTWRLISVTNNNTTGPIFQTQYQYTTNTINYIPWNSTASDQYVYDIQWRFSDDDYGIREFMFANDSYSEIAETLLYYHSLSDDEQDFEDNLYRLTLDLLYESISVETYFKDFFNEKKYKYGEINKIIQEIIDDYHRKLTEEC